MSPRCASLATSIRHKQIVDGTKVTNEYNGQVDFRVSAKHRNWRVLTFFPSRFERNITQDLYALGLLESFYFDVNNLSSSPKVCHVTFAPASKGNPSERRHLLRYLESKKYPIIWKEDNFGYEIDGAGRISKKWNLFKHPLIPAY